MFHEKTINVTKMTRLRNTRNGNPMWIITSDDGSAFRTEPNAMGVGAITGLESGPTTLVFNEFHRVVGINR